MVQIIIYKLITRSVADVDKEEEMRFMYIQQVALALKES